MIEKLKNVKNLPSYMLERLDDGHEPPLNRRSDEMVEDILLAAYHAYRKDIHWKRIFIESLADCVKAFYWGDKATSLRNAVNLCLEVAKDDLDRIDDFLATLQVELTELEWTSEKKSTSREVLRLYSSAVNPVLEDWEIVLNKIFNVFESDIPRFIPLDEDMVNAYLTCINIVMFGKGELFIEKYLKELAGHNWDDSAVIFLKKVFRRFWYLSSEKQLIMEQEELFHLFKTITLEKLTSSNIGQLQRKTMTSVMKSMLSLPWQFSHAKEQVDVALENIALLEKTPKPIERMSPWQVVNRPERPVLNL